MKSVLIAAQTPYQFFCAVLISKKLIDTGSTVSLLLIDPSLKKYYHTCLQSNIFDDLKYVEINDKYVSAKPRNLLTKMKRLSRLKLIKSDIDGFLLKSKFSSIVVFSDNHDITSYLLQAAKININAKTLLAEEGTAVFFSYRRYELGLVKATIRQALGFSNYRGYSIGWSPYIDSIIVSLPNIINEDYKQERHVYSYPSGPIPTDVIDLFGRLSELDKTPIDSITQDVFFLGQPWTDLGMWSHASEKKILHYLDKSALANRICIKPHPFEDKSKYRNLKNVSVIDNLLLDIPAEVLFYRLKPRIVISVFSSAVLNYCLRYRQKGVFMVFDEFPNNQNDFIINNFKHSEYIKVVSSIEELDDVLNDFNVFQDNANEGELDLTHLWEASINNAVFNL